MRRPESIGTNLEAFGQVLYPEDAVEPILARSVQAALDEWLEEIWAKDELQAVGLTPRHRALFEGPPGVGKTTLAHHLAARLGLALVAVRPDRLIDAWIGSTGRNIGALFDLAERAAEPVVLFLDEFDSYGIKRVSATQGADTERNNSTSPALMRQFCEGLKRNLIIGPRVGWDMQRESLVRRVIASVTPHPDLPRPRLWTRGADDPAIQRLTWPLANPSAAALRAAGKKSRKAA